MVKNTDMITFAENSSTYGNLIAIESGISIPFEVKRVYYIYGVNHDIRRGFHSHVNLKQVLICVNGSVKVEVKTPFEKEIVVLDHPSKGLVIGPMVWREMYDFSSNSVLLVLADDHFSEADYIRNYESYLNLATPYFQTIRNGQLKGQFL